MKFFTPGWLEGGMTDEDANAVAPAYRRHLKTLDLPARVSDLADLNPHDARVLQVDHDPSARTLALCLRCGDLQAGYFDVQVNFSGATIRLADVAALARAGVELLYDEVDRTSTGRFEYRLLLHPSGEVAFGFQDVAITRTPVTDRRRA